MFIDEKNVKIYLKQNILTHRKFPHRKGTMWNNRGAGATRSRPMPVARLLA
jgi:hypothetical protein